MDTRERRQRQQEGLRRLSARRARAGFLRGRVIAASIVCFGLLWAVVFLQMATGNDPVLSASSNAKATAARVSRPERSPEVDAAAEAIETTEPRELEDQSGERQPEIEVEPAPKPESEPEVVEPEVVEEPEAELEPLTTGQS
jgi:hypothetical protein